MTYHEQIMKLVQKEAAKGTSHRKILEPLANGVASVLAAIARDHGVDDRALFLGQLDKMYGRYLEAYNETPPKTD